MSTKESEDSTNISGDAAGSLDNVRTHLGTMGNRIQDYLKNVNASIENYKFNVERTDNGLRIDIAFKATIANS